MRAARLIGLLAALATTPCAGAGDLPPEGRVAVVISARLGDVALTTADLREGFLGRRTLRAGGMALTPLDNADAATRELFYGSVAGMSATRVRAYWSRIVFSGQGRPPPELAPERVLERVLDMPGTLAYVDAAQVRPGMRVIALLPY